MQRPRIRKPVANIQWTCSLGGCIRVLEVFEQSGHEDEMEERTDEDHEQRRLDHEPPERLPVWMQQGDAIRLHDRPHETDQHRQWAERRDQSRARRSMPW